MNMSKHLKRLASPRKWPIPRKTHVWVAKPSPGPHTIKNGIPLVVSIRDFIKLANTSAEARRIIGNGKILVDGRVTRHYKRPVGLMDVISIPNLKLNYRVLLDPRGKLRFIKINKDEAKWKLVRIENKVIVKGNQIQLNMHDGRNILVKKDKYKTSDVLKISLPDQKILGQYSFEPGNIAMLIGGHHVGEFAIIDKYEEIKSPKPNIVYFEDFSTIKDYVFMVGQDKSEITVPDVNVLDVIGKDTVNNKPAAETTKAKDNEKAKNKTVE
jgi:small subunit ribosomal protein S4e